MQGTHLGLRTRPSFCKRLQDVASMLGHVRTSKDMSGHVRSVGIGTGLVSLTPGGPCTVQSLA